nr:hypothetical protein [Tanacetum cinerariifolium]
MPRGTTQVVTRGPSNDCLTTMHVLGMGSKAYKVQVWQGSRAAMIGYEVGQDPSQLLVRQYQVLEGVHVGLSLVDPRMMQLSSDGYEARDPMPMIENNYPSRRTRVKLLWRACLELLKNKGFGGYEVTKIPPSGVAI